MTVGQAVGSQRNCKVIFISPVKHYCHCILKFYNRRAAKVDAAHAKDDAPQSAMQRVGHFFPALQE